MDGIDFSGLPVSVALALILIGLFWKLLARDDEKNKAFLESLTKLTTSDAAQQDAIKATQAMITEVSNGLRANAEATAKIFDTGVASASDVKKILEKIDQFKCSK